MSWDCSKKGGGTCRAVLTGIDETSHVTYNVFGGTLNLTRLQLIC